jgi:hypothetical protein
LDLFDAIIFGGRLMEWFIATLAATLVFLMLLLVKRFVVRRFKTLAKKTETDVDDLLVDLIAKTRTVFLLAVSLYIGTLFLDFSVAVTSLLKTVMILALLMQAAFWGNEVISYLINRSIRSLSGEQVIFSNADLLRSRIRNFKRMFERRVTFSIGVTYQTPSDTLERISALLKEIVVKQPNARFGPSALQRVRRFGAHLRGCVLRAEPRLQRVHGHPAGDQHRDLSPLRGREH